MPRRAHISSGRLGMDSRPTVSAIVPTFDEESHIVACLEALRESGGDEIVVVDGGSSDTTVEVAQSVADIVVETSRGLFDQLNEGSRHATGDILLFHYADSVLSEGAFAAMRERFEAEDLEGGAFRLRFDRDEFFYRWVAFWADVRNRFWVGPFGDQSIFVRAETFRELGGFRPDRALADHELARALRRRGRFRVLPETVVTSTRRWESEGRFRTMFRHLKISTSYTFGARRSHERAKRDAGELRRVR